MADIWINILGDATKLKSAVGEAGKDISGLADKVGKAGKAMTIVGGAITAAFGLTVKSSINFNREMANIATLIPRSTERVNELKSAIRTMAVDVGKDTGDLAQGAYQVISAFGDTADTVGILGIAAKAATAGVATTTDAINLLSAVTKGYGDISEGAVQKVSDLAFQTVTLGQTTFPELAGSIGRVTPLAASLGMDMEELFAVMATGTGVTGKAAEVSTQLRGVLQSLMSPTADMTNLISSMGFKSGEAMLQELGLGGALDAIAKAAEDSGMPLQKYISSIEGQTLALALTGAQSDTYIEKLAAMRDSTGLTDVAFKEQTKGVNKAGSAFNRAKIQITILSQEIGDKLLPMIVPLIEKATEIIGKIREWADAHEPLFGWIVKITATLGALALIGGPILMAASAFMKAKGAVDATVTSLKLLDTKMIVTKGVMGSLAVQTLLVAGNLIIWSEVWKTWKEIADSTKVSQDDVTDSLMRLSEQQLIAAEKIGISVQEFVKYQKEGLSVTEMMDTLARKYPGYTDALDVWTMAAVEQQVGAKLIITTVKDLTQEMSLLTKEYGAGSQAVSESIEYYNNIIDLLNRTDVILQTELMLLERGTEEWHKKKEEIADNIKALNEINQELAKLIEPLKGLELIAAKMAMLGDSTEDTKTKIELLNEKAVLLKGALDEAIPDTVAWWEAKNAFEENQNAIDGLKVKLEELTEEEKEAIVHADKLANAYKTISDKIFELTHTAMEVNIRKLDEQKQKYLDVGMAIEIVNKWYDAAIAKLKESDIALDEHKDKLEEATEATKKLGILGGETWEGLTAQIKHTTTTLNNFTKEGIAATIANIKMHFKSLIDHIRETSLAATGIWARMAEANIASLEASMAKQIGIVKYGYEEYLKIMAQLSGESPGAFKPPAFPSYQTGIRYVPKTGLALVHRAEEINPPGQRSYDQRKSYSSNSSINIMPGAINIITPKFSEADGQEMFGIIERQAKMRGLKLVRE